MNRPSRDSSVQWRHVGHCVEGERFEIDGVNVWSHEWQRVSGLTAEVKDPLYRQDYRFDVYEIRKGSAAIRFAAGEYSGNVYGFYVPDAGGVDP
jgi:hypothetical protein